MRVILFISIVLWSSLSFSKDLGISYDHFFKSFSAQVEPYKNEMGINLPKKSEVVPTLNKNTQRNIYQLDLDDTLSMIVETDTRGQITSVLSAYAVDPSNQTEVYRAIGLYAVLMGIFSPELGENKGTVLVELFQKAAANKQAAESTQKNVMYSVIPGDLLMFTITPTK